MSPQPSSPLGKIRIAFERAIALVIVLALVGIAGYAYYQVAYSKCQVPVNYDIGTIDSRFKLTEEEVRAALADAESLWEDATGKNLFTYTKGASLKVNFVYDERQQNTEEQHALIDVLDRKAEMSHSIRANYETLLDSYEDLKEDYQEKVTAYEKRLARHNSEVQKWNEKGGAPEDTYEDLNNTSASLNKESSSLNAQAKQLNDLAAQINQLGEKGNNAVEDYNESVERFNDRYEREDEFTQGDYTGSAIQIYQYDDATELRRVLAHEFGHALSLEHVPDVQAIMHSVMEGEYNALALSPDDLAEYQAVCGTR
jgi:myosin heavy subunit